MACIFRSSMALVLLLSTSLIFGQIPTSAAFQRFEHAAKSDGSVRFLVVGDWGRKGLYNQSQIATQMGRIGEKLDIDFVISAGDNFYDNGLTGVEDKAFLESFTDIYTAKSLQKQWYSVLGNHDYRGDALAQLSPVLNTIDKRWLCKRSFVVNADTTPFVESYWVDPKEHVYDWREVAPRNAYTASVLEGLESALKESSATWKIVVGHHAIRSAGHHGDTHELGKLMLPILRANNVDLYMNGHDHCLEHVTDTESPIQFLTSGAGSKSWRGDYNLSYKGLKFYHDGQGFMSGQITNSDAEFAYYDVDGNQLHKINLSKQLRVAM
ncbi:Purple acid phosphatase 17 [Asimina triloba]